MSTAKGSAAFRQPVGVWTATGGVWTAATNRSHRGLTLPVGAPSSRGRIPAWASVGRWQLGHHHRQVDVAAGEDGADALAGQVAGLAGEQGGPGGGRGRAT